MMKLSLLMAASILGLIINTACDRNRTETTTTHTGTEGLSSIQERQRQGVGSINETIAQDIQQSLMRNETLSASAKNISVSNENGTITLRGEVDDPGELNKVLNIVQTTPGVTNIDNQLTVSTRSEGLVPGAPYPESEDLPDTAAPGTSEGPDTSIMDEDGTSL